jgi:hypothetical protein
MLMVLRVFRYRSSGKLIATGLGGSVLPLNSDLSFSSKAAYRVRRDTALEGTPYRIEVETERKGNQTSYRIVRIWDENHLPPKSADPSAPLEHRIDVSPSKEFTHSEKSYVGYSAGHPAGAALMVGAFLMLFMAGNWGWSPSIVVFIAGLATVRLTRTPGDLSKIQEVNAAKERLQQDVERRLSKAMRDIRAWAALDGVEFERAVAIIYRDQGFEVEFTPRTNDQGVDLILKKSGTLSIVQCKRYASNVGVNAIRELAGVRLSWPTAHEAIVVTLFDFSGAAKTFAKQHNIKLYSIARDYLRSDYRPEV